MASEIRVDKITSLSGVGTITPSPTGIDIAGITTVATLKATTGIVTTLTATTGIVTTFEATTGDITTLRTPTGIATHFTADKISLPDSSDGSLCIGIGSDFKINHNCTDSFITEVGGGDLYIQGSDIILRDAGTLEKHIEMTQNGAVDIYHNGTKKFETSSSGVTVTGGLTATTGTFSGDVNVGAGITLDASAGIVTAANEVSAGRISMLTVNTGGRLMTRGAFLTIQAATGTVIEDLDGNNQIKGNDGGSVQLYHNGTEQCYTSSSGLAFPSGKGIDFSATADGHGTPSELLDDYEEGTYTLNIPSNGGGATITANRANYTKIGNTVRISGSFNITSTNGTNNNQARFSIPFTSAVTSYYVAHGNVVGGAGYSGDELSATIENGGPYMLFNTSVGMDDRSFSQLGTNRFDFDVVYRI